MDLTSRNAEIDGGDVSLTPKEFDLLATFARFPNVTLDREQLLDLVWGHVVLCAAHGRRARCALARKAAEQPPEDRDGLGHRLPARGGAVA